MRILQSTEETVTITRKDYNGMNRNLAHLQSRVAVLDALEAGGVDNWEWYSESLRQAGLIDDGEDEE